MKTNVLFPLQNDKILVVGLGNPGYENTYHNVGADLLHAWMKTIYVTNIKSNLWSFENIIIYTCPDYMNVSGKNISYIYKKHNCKHLIVVVDDLETSIGKIKISSGTGSKGHNGIRSILSEMKVPIYKILVGIGRPAQAIDKYVLARRTDEYNEELYTNGLKQFTQILLNLINQINKG